MHKQGSLQNGAGVKLLHYTQKKSSKGSSQENAETRNYIISMHKQGLYTSLQKGSGVKLLHYTQNKAQKGHLKRIFWAIGGYFKQNTYCIMMLGWLRKKEKMNNFEFYFSGLPYTNSNS